MERWSLPAIVSLAPIRGLVREQVFLAHNSQALWPNLFLNIGHQLPFLLYGLPVICSHSDPHPFSLSSFSLACIDENVKGPNSKPWHKNHRISSNVIILTWNLFQVLTGWVGHYWKWLLSIWLLFRLWLKQKTQDSFWLCIVFFLCLLSTI
jgi:hypothetical protein